MCLYWCIDGGTVVGKFVGVRVGETVGIASTKVGVNVGVRAMV